MKPCDVEALLAWVEKMRRIGWRGCPGDRDDYAQEAALAILETFRRKGMPLAANRSYYLTAAKRRAGLAAERARYAVSFPEGSERARRERRDGTAAMWVGVPLSEARAGRA